MSIEQVKDLSEENFLVLRELATSYAKEGEHKKANKTFDIIKELWPHKLRDIEKIEGPLGEDLPGELVQP